MATRRMRRTREVTTSGEDDESGFDLYSIQGNTSAALNAFLGNLNEEDASNKIVYAYNRLILENLNNPNNITFLKQLEEFENGSTLHERGSEGVKNRNQLIMSYNRALVHFASGDVERSINICNDALKVMIQEKKKPEDALVPVVARIAFLLLEVLLSNVIGRHAGFPNEIYDCPSPDMILEWLDTLDIDEHDVQLKFLLTLYKGRVDLAHLDESGKRIDSNVRSARKELKTAMEMYQHKLRQSFGADTVSVVSSATSDENSYHLSPAFTQDYQQQQRPSSTVLQRYGQSALTLKANLEQLKGNTKKSLILCSEAEGSTKDDGTYDAIHENNLAVVYETTGKRHLALHALSKALRASENSDQGQPAMFHNDGTVRHDATPEILHNAAICALQAKRYLSAYECMAACVSRSLIFRSRLRCWFRMAEACIGIFAELNELQQKDSCVTAVLIEGEPSGVVLDSSILQGTMKVKPEELVPNVGSVADIDQVKRNPMLRARFALEHVLGSESTSSDRDVITAAQLSLAYVNLAFKNYQQAFNMSAEILKHEEECNNIGSVSNKQYTRRQFATARMYAAESLLNLSKAQDAMQLLVGDENDVAFDFLAFDISGVSSETAAVNEKAKRRLAKAKAMVRSSGCAVYTATGNIEAAIQLANSAPAVEGAIESNLECSVARRALIYTLLREGQQSPALELLTSLR